MDNKKLLGKRIKEIRKLKNYTQEELAEIVNLETSSLSGIESGRFFPSLHVLDKLSQALNVELVELKGYTRKQVACLMNASDVALMTSFTEGSPQFVKEAMACACPVVSTDVGDVRELLQGIDNSYITTYEPQDVANALFKVLSNGNRNEQAYARIRDNYELSVVDEKLICIYKKVTGK